MASASCREPVPKIVGSLYRFGPEIVGQSAVDEHRVLHCDDSSPSSLGELVLFVHVWGRVLDCDPTLLGKTAKFDGNEFSSTVYT